ncbi:inositol monophosphatase [Thiomicrospira sp. R3]|uniref:inositol monophosphatase family protein n=1 Tax=Thiomicrospira sp. R3 TaxID=3035472 RepID=UPI00259B0847|nr:inositol monophosphatase [Thiomicrospira sp. R3]WFE68874.1 inositol monophosphatase [Thiomicrospira sp. R3]
MMHPFINNQAWLTLKSGLTEIAKQEIMTRFNNTDYELKSDGSLLTEADTAMQKAMKAFLHLNWPEFTLVGEESDKSEQQAALDAEQGCWILDPIDGTTNFANGIAFFSVSLALMIKGEVVLGLVYDPARDELFSARLGLGAQLNNQPIKTEQHLRTLNQCVGIVDFKRLDDALATALAIQAPYSSQRSFGSVALDWCWIAAGRGQLYLHGNQSLWDYAAGWLILNEAGGASISLDNQPVLVKKISKRPAVAASNLSLLQTWKNWIDRHNKE